MTATVAELPPPLVSVFQTISRAAAAVAAYPAGSAAEPTVANNEENRMNTATKAPSLFTILSPFPLLFFFGVSVESP